jgi:beta-lactam-binding protein with PASTA domain
MLASQKLKQFLWILPFFCFLGSYFLFHCLLTTTALTTPSLIGKQLQEAIQILSDHNLNARILSQKEDNDLTQGTIINQMPAPHRKIRPHQSVFFVISKKSPQKMTPDFQQKNKQNIEKIASDEAISLKILYLPSNYPINTCIGQIPNPHQPLVDHRMTVYLSGGSATKPVILPSFKNRTMAEVSPFLTENTIKFITIHAKPIEPNHMCNCTVTDQKPLAGSLIDLKKPLTVQLYVQ